MPAAATGRRCGVRERPSLTLRTEWTEAVLVGRCLLTAIGKGFAVIGVLYESREWSDYKLAAELAEAGCEVRMIDLALADGSDEWAGAALFGAALECDLLVSRVFASAVFRKHAYAHELMANLIPAVEARGIAMVNPPRAHFFEIDKRRAVEELARAGVDVPCVQACGTSAELAALIGASSEDAADEASTLRVLRYPCIIKPNCGGRTTYTAIARTDEEARAFLDGAPDFEFIVEDYLLPERGFITRIELVDGACELAVKRSVVDGGLSAYHLGSTYELYHDLPAPVRATAEAAGRALSIEFGSFDIIEAGGRAFVIDANSVSNVSPDNTATFGGFDLMREYARAIARRL